jgi:hypothetical protein
LDLKSCCCGEEELWGNKERERKGEREREDKRTGKNWATGGKKSDLLQQRRLVQSSLQHYEEQKKLLSMAEDPFLLNKKGSGLLHKSSHRHTPFLTGGWDGSFWERLKRGCSLVLRSVLSNLSGKRIRKRRQCPRGKRTGEGERRE